MDLGRFGIEEERHADDDGAEVEGPGERGGDDRQRQRRPSVAAGEVGLAADLQRRGSGPRGDGGDANLTGVRAAGLGRSAAPVLAAAAAIEEGGQ